MLSEAIPRTYAEALFDLARKHEGPEAFGAALEAVAEIVDSEPSFRDFLATPRVSEDEKRRVLRDVFGDRVPEPFLQFLLLVLDRGRQGIFPDIAREYRKLLDDHLGRVRVEVRVARPVDEETERDMAQRLSEALGRQALPQIKVEPELLGGAVFRVGDVVYDGSVRRRLRGLRRELLAAPIE